MSPSFKPNNFFAILIAIILVVIGFTLAFVNKQAEAARAQTSATHVVPAIVVITDGPRQHSRVHGQVHVHHVV